LLFTDEPENEPVAIFNNIWEDFNENYGIFEERGVNWDQVYQEYSNQITEVSDEDDLFNVISSMLAELDDGHVTLTAPGRPVFRSNRILNELIYDDLFNKELILQHYISDFKEDTVKGYLYGLIDDVIYLHLPWISDNFSLINDLIDKYENSKGLILDLRHNTGGDFTYAYSEMGRFVDEKRLVFTSRTKNGQGPDDFTSTYEWYVEPSGKYYGKKIVVLTDRYTISAGERTVMAFMVLPNVTIIGDTTNGSHSTMIGRELANGWYYTISTQKIKLFDGISYEGIGLAPDIYFRNRITEMEKGVDETLEIALGEFSGF
jgi:C-terminal processing protease CtpA/Prc